MGPRRRLAIVGLGMALKPHIRSLEELSDRVPTVVYAVQVRANEPAPLMRAMAYVSDRMPTRMIRDVITSALERASKP